MRFTERKDFLTDPEVFGLESTKTALRIYASHVRKHSARPAPKFFELDRAESHYDSLWHATTAPHEKIAREIEMPSINKFIKPSWNLTRLGIVPQRRDDFILAYNILQELNYFPQRGDRVYWNGYRYAVINVVLDPEAYWQQTNQWMGLRVECIVPPEGDARPLPDLSQVAPIEGPAEKVMPTEAFIPRALT